MRNLSWEAEVQMGRILHIMQAVAHAHSMPHLRPDASVGAARLLNEFVVGPEQLHTVAQQHERSLFPLHAIVADEAIAPLALSERDEHVPGVPVLVVGQGDGNTVRSRWQKEGAQQYFSVRHLQDIQPEIVKLAQEAPIAESWRPSAVAGTTLEAALEALGQKVETIPDRVWVKDKSLRFVYANYSFLRDMGWDDEGELLGKTERELWEAGVTKKAEREDREVMARGEIQRRTTPEGKVSVKVPILDDNGEAVGLVRVLTADPGDRNRAWTDLYHWASIFVTSHDAIISTSAEGYIIGWNPASERMYGYGGEEVLGTHIERLASPAERSALRRAIAEAAHGTTVLSLTQQHVAKGGRQLFSDMALSPIMNAYGRIWGISIVVHDITERVQMEEMLKETLTRLAHANMELGEFADAASRGGAGAAPRHGMEQVALAMRSDPYGTFDFRSEARRLNLSYSHFRRLFKAHTGYPPYDYLLMWRMRTAAQALQDGTRPIKAIAREAGYDNPGDFSRMFRKKMGISPQEYRDSVLGK
jgi:PAS domain S-box-containing protein